MFKTIVPLYKNFFSNWLLILTEIHWNKLWRRFKIWLACVRKCLCPFKWDKRSSYSSVFSMIWNGLYERWPEYFVFMYLTVEWMKGRWIFFFFQIQHFMSWFLCPILLMASTMKLELYVEFWGFERKKWGFFPSPFKLLCGGTSGFRELSFISSFVWQVSLVWTKSVIYF